jgi:hypothetical protein
MGDSHASTRPQCPGCLSCTMGNLFACNTSEDGDNISHMQLDDCIAQKQLPLLDCSREDSLEACFRGIQYSPFPVPPHHQLLPRLLTAAAFLNVVYHRHQYLLFLFFPFFQIFCLDAWICLAFGKRFQVQVLKGKTPMLEHSVLLVAVARAPLTHSRYQ